MTGINENDETEVIAVRSTAMAWQMVFTLIFVSCFIIVLVVVNNRISSLGTELHTFDLIFWLFVVFFAGILCYDIYQLVQIIRTPREVVVATGNKFFFLQQMLSVG